MSPLFPLLFTRIELQWRGVRLCPGVIKLVMSGEEPSPVPDEVIAAIRQRERNESSTTLMADPTRPRISAAPQTRQNPKSAWN